MTSAECTLVGPDALLVKRRFKARREIVWKAWTEPERFTKWFGSHGWKCAGAVLDNRVGGERSMSLRDPDGQEVRVFGEYTEFTPEARIAFTWNVDGPGRDVKGTLVTIDFIEHPEGTELQIQHAGLTDPAIRQEHSEGWMANLELVAEFVDG